MKIQSNCWYTTVTLTLGLLAGCAQKVATPALESQAITPAPAVPPTPAQLLGATVSGVFEQAVTLVDGAFTGEPVATGGAARPTLRLWAPSIAFGNVVDDHAGNEAVALLSSSAGGSGEFVHVGVFGTHAGQARSLSVAPVGDRVKLHRLWLEGGKIVMDVVEAGPGEAACCPTQLARKSFAWQDGGLQQLASTPVGTLSVNLLTATDWMLIAMDGQPLPEGVVPPTALVQFEKLAGFAGCNRYSAALTESRPGSIAVGALATTKKACTGPGADIELQFLDRMGKADGYTLQAGQLLVTAPAQGGSPRTLLFAR